MPTATALLIFLALAAALPLSPHAWASGTAQAQGPASALTPGDAFAQGYRHLTGETVPRDATLAAKFFLQAATAGEPQAQFQLGAQFMDGVGMPKDGLWAYYWLDMAARAPSLPEAVRVQARGRIQALMPVLTMDEKRRLGMK